MTQLKEIQDLYHLKNNKNKYDSKISEETRKCVNKETSYDTVDPQLTLTSTRSILFVRKRHYQNYIFVRSV